MNVHSQPRGDSGMVTSEYAVATIGACGVACVLISLSPQFEDFLRAIIERGFAPIVTGLW